MVTWSQTLLRKLTMPAPINSTHGTLKITRGQIFGNGNDVAVTLENSNLVVEDTNVSGFTAVAKGVGNCSIDAKNVIHAKGGWDADAIPLDVLRRMANVNV
jgi:hypothetical protein